ncbi:MAG: hypothetical protein IJS39_06275 [Synergistaceae bacterium]|nr:hypothetical protein [Synergistaceae bacterium]
MRIRRMIALAVWLVLTICAGAWGDVAIDETNFPDSIFRSHVSSSYDTDSNGYLSDEEIAAVTNISVFSMGISSLKGVEYFTALTSLYCDFNQLTELDVSKNTALTDLKCYNNQLTELDVSKNIYLTELWCHDNKLTTLDVSNCASLDTLGCYSNQLTELDVSKHTALTYLRCDNNKLTVLDVSKNTDLTHLECQNNQLKELDVSKNVSLDFLACENNQLTELDVSKHTALTHLGCSSNQLTSLDVSRNTALTHLACDNNQLTELDLTQNTALTYLDCQNNQLTSLDVSNNTKLTSLGCQNNQLTSLDVSNCASLDSLWCQDNQLTNLDVSKNSALRYLECTSNQFTELDVTKNTALTDLYCGDNLLKTLDVSQNTALTGLQCYTNQLTTLDLRNNPDLTGVWCATNQLTSLDVSNNTKLTGLLCSGNQLTALDVSNNTKLMDLQCDNNQLTELDVSKNVSLDVLDCDSNKLTVLDVSKNTALTRFECGDNQLTELDLSKNTALTSLHCGENQLTELDVSKNTALTGLGCDDNQLTELDVSKNVSLDSLGCGGNPLTSLDLSQNAALTDLWCEGCQLTELDLRNNPALTHLGCAVNPFTELDLSRNTALTELECRYNHLAALDVSGCASLYSLMCESQTVSVTSPNTTGDSSYPYSLKFSALSASLDISRVYSLDVTDYYGNTVNFVTDTSASAQEWTFNAKPKSMTYYYYTGHSGSYMDVTATLAGDAESFALSASSTDLNIALGRSATITLTASGIYGTASYSADAPAEAGLTLSGNTAAFSPTASGTYIVTFTVTDSGRESGSNSASVTVSLTVSIPSSWTAVTESSFPDSAFRSYITENYDSDGDGYISDIDGITQLELSGLGIADLTGLELFTGITYLDCSNNSLTSLDISSLTLLQYLNCNTNSLTALNTSSNPDLYHLECRGNQISALDLSGNLALTYLLVGSTYKNYNTDDAQNDEGNNLTALDVTQNTLLEYLCCAHNQITSLDLTHNTELQELDCSDNLLTTLDLTQNTKLLELHCWVNSFGTLDVSNNTELTFLNCPACELTALDVSNNTKLELLYCNNNKITALDISKNSALHTLQIQDNQIAALDASSSTALTMLGEETINSMASTYWTPGSHQYVYIPKAEASSNSPYTYQLDLNARKSELGISADISDFVSRVQNLSIKDSRDNDVEHYTDTASGIVYFSAKPKTLSYKYDVKMPADPSVSIDVAVQLGEPVFRLAPSSMTLTFTLPDVASRTVTLTTVNALGSVSYTSSQTWAVISGDTVTITPPAAVGNYEAVITGVDEGHTEEENTDSVTITVYVVQPSAPEGITGISVTSPAAKSITLSADGGTFSAALSASGTPYGSVVWSLSATQGLSADITGSGSTAALSGTAQPNTSSQDISGTITVTAHDDTGTNYSDTLTVIVSGITQSIDITSKDPSPDITTITGIAFTPATLTLSADGGQANFTASVQGTPSGDVSWSVSPETYTLSQQSGSSVNITGSVPANTTADDIPHTVRVTARDSVNTVSADFSVIVAGRTPEKHEDPSKDERPYYEKYTGDSWSDAYVLGLYSDFMDLVSRFLDGSESAGKYYAIDADIDLSAVANFQSIGSEANPFKGHFNGNGRTITIPANARGLFGLVDTDGIAIQNLTVRTAPSLYNGALGGTAPTDYSGGIVQELASGTITGCTFSGTVTADGTDSSAGGIVGLLSGGTVQNCRVLSGSGVYASHSAGGIVGYVIAGTIADCTSDADVDAEFSGGIAGYTEAERQNLTGNSYTSAVVEAGNDILSIDLLPNMQTVSAGAAITDIEVSSDNAAVWSFRVSGDYALGLTSRDMVISGTIPAGTQEGTYTVTVDALNSNGFTASAQAYITVTRAIIPDSGDVISGDIISEDIPSGDITSDDPRPIPPTPGRRENSVDYAFDMPSMVMYRMAMLFGGESVYQFTDDEIISGLWELDGADSRAIADLREHVVLHLPVMRPRNSGLYMLRLNLSETGAGKKISLYGITSGTGGVSATTLEDMDYILLDEEGNEISEVPENGIVYAALRLTANREHRGVITSPIELEQGTIQPIEPDETLLEKIAETVKISADRIMFITEENISDPQEPTDDMRSELAVRQNEILGKFNTVTVDKTGYYVLKVTLSDDLYERIKGVSVNELKVYALHDDGRTSSADVGASFITGLLNTWELLTLTGEKMEFGMKEFLMVGLLNAGTPFSVYLTKLIIMLLLGGCASGLGIAGFAVVSLGAVFLIIRRKL